MQQNAVFVNNDGIVEITLFGNQSVETVTAMGKQIAELLQQQKAKGLPALILDDLLEMGQVPADARKMVIQLGRALPYDRCAMLGRGGALRLGTNLMLRATGRGNTIQYFDNREAAIRWLKDSVQTQTAIA